MEVVELTREVSPGSFDDEHLLELRQSSCSSLSSVATQSTIVEDLSDINDCLPESTTDTTCIEELQPDDCEEQGSIYDDLQFLNKVELLVHSIES